MKTPYHFPRTRVKICGFTRKQDVTEAARLGVDAIGLVFYPNSPRAVGITEARDIIESLPPFVSVVALFVDEREQRIRDVLKAVNIDLIQFHGNESRESCESFGIPYIKAVGMRDGLDLNKVANHYQSAAALLLDVWDPQKKGGTGHQFDWNRIPEQCGLPIVLAGGLTVENVRVAIETVRPYGVDISSGVEITKGIKDAGKMALFLEEVNQFKRAKFKYG